MQLMQSGGEPPEGPREPASLSWADDNSSLAPSDGPDYRASLSSILVPARSLSSAADPSARRAPSAPVARRTAGSAGARRPSAADRGSAKPQERRATAPRLPPAAAKVRCYAATIALLTDLAEDSGPGGPERAPTDQAQGGGGAGAATAEGDDHPRQGLQAGQGSPLGLAAIVLALERADDRLRPRAVLCCSLQRLSYWLSRPLGER